MKRLGSSAGFTLVEILVATGIAAFITFVGYYAISTTIAASNESTARVRDTENARLFFTMLKRDIATAFPGPGNMSRGRAYINQGATYNPDPNSAGNQATLVITENGSSVSPESHILQFYCRADNPTAAGDTFLFVRYYINRADNTLCRQALNCNYSTIPRPDGTPLLTNDPSSSHAVFDGLRTLKIAFQKWDQNSKRYLNVAAASGEANCDALLVTLTFADLFSTTAIQTANGGATNSSTTAGTAVDFRTSRTYSTVISIPTTF